MKLLDVTLRDGGYQNNFAFSATQASEVVGGLKAAGIEWIEVGYRNGSLKAHPGAGESYYTSNDYIAQIRADHPDAKLVVMVHPQHVDFDDIQDLANLGVSAVRVCFNPKLSEKSVALIRAIRSAGMLATVNLTRVTYLTEADLLSFAKACDDVNVDVIYLADSNGHMIPAEVFDLVIRLRAEVRAEIGFHAHNNLSLALANSIEALRAGATWIDSSLHGLGRGAGNLSTEGMVAYLKRTRQNSSFKWVKLLEFTDQWNQKNNDILGAGSSRELFYGVSNFSADFQRPLEEASQKEGFSVYEIGNQLAGLRLSKPESAFFDIAVGALKKQSGVYS